MSENSQGKPDAGRESLLTMLRQASWGGKLRFALLYFLALGVLGATTLAIVAILHLHFLPVTETPEIGDRGAGEGEATPIRETNSVPPAGTAAPSRFPFPYEIRSITVPVANRHGTKALYLQFTITLDCPSQAAQTAMSMNVAKLRNSLYEVAIRFNEDDFRDDAGFGRFRAAIEKKLREVFTEDAPRQIALSDWLLN